MAERVIIRKPDEKNTGGKYYLLLSKRARQAKFVSVALLVLLSVSLLLIFRSSITEENLQYMFRDLSISGDSVFSDLTFDSDGNPTTALYRGDLLVLDSKSVNLYSSGGSRGLSKSFTYTDPAVTVSERYFIVYDKSGTGFSVFNSYSKLYSENYSYPITAAAAADSGAFALVTSTREYSTAVYVYNKDFKRIREYCRNRYPVSVKFDGSGNSLLLVSLYAESGEFVTEVTAFDVTGKRENVTVTLRGVYPLGAEWHENGNFTIISDENAYFYDRDGNLLSSYSFGSGAPSRFAFDGECTAVFLERIVNSAEYDLVLFDSSGNILYNETMSDEIVDAALYGQSVYILLEDSVEVIDSENEVRKFADCNPDAERIFVFSSGRGNAVPVAVTKGSATAVSFDSE